VFTLCLLLKFPQGFIPSIASPSLKFLGSTPKFGNVSSIFFHCGESAGCRRRLSHFLPSTCHFRFFASSLMENVSCFDPTQVHSATIIRNNHRVSEVLSALEYRGAPSQFFP